MSTDEHHTTPQELTEKMIVRSKEKPATKEARKTIKKAKLLIAEYMIKRHCVYRNEDQATEIDVKVQRLIDLISDTKSTAKETAEFRNWTKSELREMGSTI